MGKANEELIVMIEGITFDQPCIFGGRVKEHSVYCNNDASPYRKCHCSWFYGRAVSLLDKCADENCQFFKPNPDYSENLEKLAQEIAMIEYEREKGKEYFNELTQEGYLCHKCIEASPSRDYKTLCNCGTLVMGKVKYKEDKSYTEKEIDTHFTLDPMLIEMRKECQLFKEKQ